MEYGNGEQLISHLERLRIPDFYVTPDFATRVLPYVTDQVLGKGGAASEVRVVNIPGSKEELVLKYSRPCAFSTPIFDRYCDDLRSPTALRREPHGDKELIDVPNSLLEGLIGSFMNRLVRANQTPHFVPIYGVWSDPNEEVSYTLLPRLKTNLKKIIQGVADVYLILFQFAQGLSVAQEVNRFTHYDPHDGNWFYSEDTVDRAYPVMANDKGGIKWLGVKSRGYTMKLGDYGLSRMEAPPARDRGKRIVLEGTVTDYPVPNFGVFNRNYDMAAIVGALFAHRTNEPYSKDIPNSKHSFLAKVNVTDALKSEIYSIVFGISKASLIADINGFEEKTFVKDWWRPKQGVSVSYLELPSIHTIVRNLGEKLVNLGLSTPYDSLDDAKDHRYKPLVPLPRYRYMRPWRVEQEEFAKPEKVINVIPGVTYRFLSLNYRSSPESWKWTPSDKELEHCPNRTQFLNIMYVNTKVLSGSDYSIRFECCKLDPIDYLSEHYGVAINGGFFDIGAQGTYEPIGSYKSHQRRPEDPDLIFGHPVPTLYKDYYGALALTNGKPSIVPRGTIFPSPNTDYMYCGPMLVRNGKVVMTEAVIQSIKKIGSHDVSLFQCRLPPEDEKDLKFLPPGRVIGVASDCTKRDRHVTSLIPNCNKLRPGELSHAGNSNPRTCVFTRENSDNLGDLVFLYVEGRDDRGVGMNLVELAKIVKSLGAIDALNLDGGRSSAMAWHTEDDPDVIHMARHKTFYPVGDLITITKK